VGERVMEAAPCAWGRGVWEISVSFAPFCCEHKTAFKSLLRNSETEILKLGLCEPITSIYKSFYWKE
jgi:hypothetical protein